MSRRTLSAALALVVVPAVLLVWLRAGVRDRLDEVSVQPDPVLLEVANRSGIQERPVTVELRWGEPPPLLAPSWIGTVTRVDMRPGERVRTGEVLLTVDAVARVAAHTPVPFWRPLASSDVGPDVAALQKLLGRLGFFQGAVDGRFGQELEGAVKAWAETLGVARPTGTFDPGWVVWLPRPSFLLVSIDVSVGAPAPPQGSVIATGPLPLTEATLRTPDGSPIEVDDQWVLEVQGVEFQLTRRGGVRQLGLKRLAETAEAGTESVAGMIRPKHPRPVIEVPATAVMSNKDGDICVWVQKSNSFESRPVTLGGGRVSLVEVEGGLAQGEQVLVNPAEILEDPACPLR